MVARAKSAHMLDWANANWKWVIFLLWLGIATYYLQIREDRIYWFALGDTDDNIRYLQVRDWLAGQDWFDLRQYRLDPPAGADIHWSRIVDLPIAALMLLFRLFMEQGQADRWACAVAPLLPLLLLMLSLAFITRRLTRAGNGAWIVAAVLPIAAPMGIAMYMPLRIDHHGWQLALTVTMLAGIVDVKWLRGGIVAGLASALSLAIGMEMIVYLAGAGGLIALRWVFKPGAARRMLPYGLALGGGSALLFVLFASTANRAYVCDALSPIWVVTFSLVAAAMTLLALLPLKNWPQRLGAGAIAGAIIGAFLLWRWPECFTGAYQISPELERLWLANIREAKPVTEQGASKAISMLALPVGGALAALLACFMVRRDSERLWAWGTVALMTLFALGLTFWQIRAAPAAQLLAIPAMAWAIWGAAVQLLTGRIAVRVGGLVVIGSVAGLLNAQEVYSHVARSIHPAKPLSVTGQNRQRRGEERMGRIRRANAMCRSGPALAPLNQLPPATIFTLVDLGPRLIATTHHSAIAGPYHRNEGAILDIHHAFDGTGDEFRRIAQRHGAAYLLVCPDFPEGTVYRARSPGGFYDRLEKGEVPGWLHPVELRFSGTLPYRLYRIEFQR